VGKLESGPERDARPFLPLPAPFGCSFTTVHDLYKFSQALLAGRLVSRKSRELMVKTDRSAPGDLVDHYGYGVMTDLVHGVPYFGHDGGVWGVNAVFRMTPEGDVVVEGSVLGSVGDTGNARGTPPHLHYGVYASDGAIDPLPLLRANERTVIDAPPSRR
jgi:hypothetical protein